MAESKAVLEERGLVCADSLRYAWCVVLDVGCPSGTRSQSGMCTVVLAIGAI